eukprot:TRINITY_DN3188_c0_g1_i11.p1 TRINITY_DN3188_c0_g1~~TRINITY_DN3188_c0_g1_i11.p1  ORF type:complete len:620 (-),score=18.33 TRINITY_DN3188_c0_g1_i11:399-2258(-)
MGGCFSLPFHHTEEITLKVAITQKKGLLQPKIIHTTDNIEDPVYTITFLPRALWTGKDKLGVNKIKEEAKNVALQLHSSDVSTPSGAGTSSELLFHVPKFPYIIKYAISPKLASVDFFHMTSVFFGYCIIDRTGTLEGSVKTKVLDPIPQFDRSFKLSLNDVCLKRAQEIMRVASENNYKIKILWSGGIDSTGVLVAFLKSFPLQTLKEQLVVLYTSASIDEYPKFYSSHRKHLNFQLWSGRFEDLLGTSDKHKGRFARIDNNDLLVTGEHGDQLFGSDLMRWAFASPKIQGQDNYLHKALNVSWQSILPKMLEQTDSLPRGFGQSWVSWILLQVQKSPITITTVFDFLWWFNFSMKWQNVTMRILTKCTQDPQSLESLYNRTYHFYRSSEFQQWSYHNHKDKLPNRLDWFTYKQPLKDFIYTYNKDSMYRMYKQKKVSLRLRYTQENNFGPNVAISSDFKQIGWGDHSICLELMKHKYGPEPLKSFLTYRAQSDSVDQQGSNSIGSSSTNISRQTSDGGDITDFSNFYWANRTPFIASHCYRGEGLVTYGTLIDNVDQKVTKNIGSSSNVSGQNQNQNQLQLRVPNPTIKTQKTRYRSTPRRKYTNVYGSGGGFGGFE